MSLKHTFVGHKGQINALDMAPSTPYLASGGRDSQVMIWNLVEGKHLGKIDCDAPVNAVKFAPKKYWLVMGTETGIRVWDLRNKVVVTDLVAHAMTPSSSDKKTKPRPIACTSLVWNKSGSLLFAGFTDNIIRVYKIVKAN
jgi:guanine nucleotide-binding protein subunit beta-2-like 1 protein